MTAMDKNKARTKGNRLIDILILAINIVLVTYLLFAPLIIAKYQLRFAMAISVYEWIDWYRALFKGRKECIPRWATLYTVFCWGSLALLALAELLNFIRLFVSDSTVYDIILYTLLGIVAAMIVTDIRLLFKSGKEGILPLFRKKEMDEAEQEKDEKEMEEKPEQEMENDTMESY